MNRCWTSSVFALILLLSLSEARRCNNCRRRCKKDDGNNSGEPGFGNGVDSAFTTRTVTVGGLGAIDIEEDFQSTTVFFARPSGPAGPSGLRLLLPLTVTHRGRWIVVRNFSTTFGVTVVANAGLGDNIDGSLPDLVIPPNEARTFVSDGVNTWGSVSSLP